MNKDSGPLKIDKGIPIPDSHNGFRSMSYLTDTVKSMKVGDSFLYPRLKRSIFGSLGRYHNIKLTTRAVSETQVRVWRIG